MDTVYLISILVVILYIWFDTDAFVQWAKMFRLKFLKLADFTEASKSSMVSVTYPEFLEKKYSNFFILLITCPVCLGIWLNILTIPLISLKTIGLNIILTLLGYFLFQKILNKLYV